MIRVRYAGGETSVLSYFVVIGNVRSSCTTVYGVYDVFMICERRSSGRAVVGAWAGTYA